MRGSERGVRECEREREREGVRGSVIERQGPREREALAELTMRKKLMSNSSNVEIVAFLVPRKRKKTKERERERKIERESPEPRA